MWQSVDRVLQPMTFSYHTASAFAILVASNGVRTTAVTLFSNRQLNTLALWQGDPWLLMTDDEDIALTGSERVVYGVLDVDNVETSIVTLTVGNDTNTTHVATTSSHGNDTSVELNEVGNLSGCKVDLYSVVNLDGWVRVSNSSSIVRDQEWDSALAQLYSLDLAELVFGLLSLNSVDSETALGVVDKTEVLASLLDGNDIHEACWVCSVGADLAIDLDQALHDNGLGLTCVESILQTVSDEYDEGHALAELVRTCGWTRSVGTGQFVQKPM